MSQNYFDFFGLTPAFDVDTEELRKRFLSISKENHPDFFASDPHRLEQAIELTSINNRAYETLQKRMSRIAYMLQTFGEPEWEKEALEPDFLMEMMEWNERITDAGMAEDKDAWGALIKEFRGYECQLDADLWQACLDWDKGQGGDGLRAIHKHYIKTKYLLRIQEAIDNFAHLSGGSSQGESDSA